MGFSLRRMRRVDGVRNFFHSIEDAQLDAKLAFLAGLEELQSSTLTLRGTTEASAVARLKAEDEMVRPGHLPLCEFGEGGAVVAQGDSEVPLFVVADENDGYVAVCGSGCMR